jgi:hypothetical protein
MPRFGTESIIPGIWQNLFMSTSYCSNVGSNATERKISQLILIYTFLSIGLLCCLIASLLVPTAIRAQPVESEESTVSIVNQSSYVSKPRQSFQGDSLLTFYSWNFHNEQVMNEIDNHTSNGYDVKGIVPYKDRFAIILEKVNSSQ